VVGPATPRPTTTTVSGLRAVIRRHRVTPSGAGAA
jgi:hypothetical protein